MSEWRRMNGGGNAAAGGAVVMVAVDASKDVSDNALEWAIRNVVWPKDALILLALIKPSTSSSGKLQSQAAASNASDGNKFLGSLRKKFARKKVSVKENNDRDSSTDSSSSENPNRCFGFDDERVKWIYEVCLDMLSDLCCENDVEQVRAQVKVVPSANITSVANIAEENRADWVILDRRLKKESDCCTRRLNCNIVTVNHAVPTLLKTVNTEGKREESTRKANLLSLLSLTDESSSTASSSLKSTMSTVSRSSASSSDRELEGGGGSAPANMSAGIFASRQQPAQPRNSPQNQHRSISTLPLPPGRQPGLDNVSRFKKTNPEGISQGRLSEEDVANKSRNLYEPKPKYRDIIGSKDTIAGKQEPLTPQDTWATNADKTADETKRIGGVATQTNTAVLPTRLDRSSSIRREMSISVKQPRTPPPLCSVCRHNAPAFGKPPRKFSYREMEIATEGFSRRNFLAEGGYGPVYRGVLDDGQVVAVKKHKEASAQGAAEFCSEVEVLSCAQHRNLVMLVGYCVEEEEWLLVYEFACNGSLDKHLHLQVNGAAGNGKGVMAWKHRRKVAIGTARGLRYLHEDCRVGCIIHRDLRPNNILLTHDFEAMVGDFGLARWQTDGQSAEETRIVGTLGYLAPEYTQTGQITEKADVYAFGVLMMELITGVKAIDLIRRGMHLRHWTTPLIENMNVQKLIDPQLKGRYDRQEAEYMMHVASLCVSPEPETRPRMSKVLRLLEGEIESDRASHQHTQAPGNVSNRPSKMLGPLSRSANGEPHSRSPTPTSRSSSGSGSEFDRRSKTPPPPSRFSENPSNLRSRRPTSMSSSSDGVTHQQHQTPTTSTDSDRAIRLRSRTPPLPSRSNVYLPSHIRSSTLFEEKSLVLDTYNLPAEEEELRRNNIMKPTNWLQTDAVHDHQDDDLSSREYQAYLQDSFFQFIQNTK